MLIWEGGAVDPACDRAGELQASVEAYLARRVFVEPASLRIRVKLRPDPKPGRIVADVSQEDERGPVAGVRSVVADGCDGLEQPLTLVVALMVDAPVAVSSSEPPRELVAPGPAPEPPADVTDAGPIATTPSLDRAPAEPGHVTLAASGMTGMGVLPSIAYGFDLSLTLKPSWFWGLQLRGGALGSPALRIDAQSELDFDLLFAGASLCPLATLRDGLLLRFCAGFNLARLRAKSTGLVPARDSSELVLLPEVRGELGLELLGPLGVGGFLGAAFPIAANRYVYRDLDAEKRQAFQMAPLSVLAGLVLSASIR